MKMVAFVPIFLVAVHANAKTAGQADSAKQVSVYLKRSSYTVKNIRRFYGKINGNQLPVHFPLFFTGALKHFQESGTEW